MGQGIDDKIRQISDMLSSQEAQDGIRQLFSSFNPADRGNRSDTSTLSAEESDSDMSISGSPRHMPLQEADWIIKIQNMLSQMNNVQDSRINLLRSVHPFLNNARKERCSACINILKVAEIIRAMTNSSGRLL